MHFTYEINITDEFDSIVETIEKTYLHRASLEEIREDCESVFDFGCDGLYSAEVSENGDYYGYFDSDYEQYESWVIRQNEDEARALGFID